MVLDRKRDTGMAIWARRTRRGPGRYVAANICIIPARQSRKPIMAKGFLGRFSCWEVMVLFNHPNLATGIMYAKERGMYMKVVRRLRKLG